MSKKKLIVKVDSRIVEGARLVLDNLGLTMDEAVNIFLYQVFYSQSMPLSIKVPPKDIMEQFDEYFKIYEGLEEANAGKCIPGEEVFARLREKYNTAITENSDTKN